MSTAISKKSIQEIREQIRAEEIGPNYSSRVHFMLTHAIVIIGCTVGLAKLDSIQWWEWLIVPITFLYANLAEYLGHRFVMHHKRPGFGLIYRRHVGLHHHFFTDASMPVDSPQDWKIVLFPPILIALFLGAFGTPVAILVGHWVSPNAAWLFTITGLLYFLNYEYLHLAYHLPKTHWVHRLPMMQTLARLHTDHHNHGLMSHHNFNITYPICDFIFGTLNRSK